MKTLQKHLEDIQQYKDNAHYVVECDFCHTKLFCGIYDFEKTMFKPKESECEVLKCDENGKQFWKRTRQLFSSDTSKDTYSCKCCVCGHSIKLTGQELNDCYEPNEGNKNISFVLTEKETEAAKAFMEQHYEHSKQLNATVCASFSFIITPTSIGDTVHIRCIKCGEEKDITEYDKF